MPVATFLLIINKDAEEEQTEETVHKVVQEALGGAKVFHVWQDPKEISRAVALVDPKGNESIAAKFKGSKTSLPVIAWAEPAESLYVDVKGFASLQFGTVDKLRMLFTLNRHGGGKCKVHSLTGPGWGMHSCCFQVKFDDGWDAVYRAYCSRCTVEGRKLTIVPLFPCFFKDRADQIQHPHNTPMRTTILKEQSTGNAWRRDSFINAQETVVKPFSEVKYEEIVPLRDTKRDRGLQDLHADIEKENQDKSIRKSMDRGDQGIARSTQNTAAKMFDQGQVREERAGGGSIRALAMNCQAESVKMVAEGWPKTWGQSRGGKVDKDQDTDVAEVASKNLAEMEREDQEMQGEGGLDLSFQQGDIKEAARKYLAEMEREEKEKERGGKMDRSVDFGLKGGITSGYMQSRSNEHARRGFPSSNKPEVHEKQGFRYNSPPGKWKEHRKDAMQQGLQQNVWHQPPDSDEEMPEVNERQHMPQRKWSKEGHHDTTQQTIVNEMKKEAQDMQQNAQQRLSHDRDKKIAQDHDSKLGTPSEGFGGSGRIYSAEEQSEYHHDHEGSSLLVHDKETFSVDSMKLTFSIVAQSNCPNQSLGWLLQNLKCESGLSFDFEYQSKVIILVCKTPLSQKYKEDWECAVETECKAWAGKDIPPDMSSCIKKYAMDCQLAVDSSAENGGKPCLVVVTNTKSKLSLLRWVDYVCSQDAKNYHHELLDSTPSKVHQNQEKEFSKPIGWSRKDLTNCKNLHKRELKNLEDRFKYAGFRLEEDHVVLSNKEAYPQVKQALSVLLKHVQDEQKKFKLINAKDTDTNERSRLHEGEKVYYWPADWSPQTISTFLQFFPHQKSSLESLYKSADIRLSNDRIILRYPEAYEALKESLADLLPVVKRHEESEHGNNRNVGTVERSNVRGKQSMKCKQEIFNFPHLDEFLMSYEGSELVRAVCEQFKCQIEAASLHSDSATATNRGVASGYGELLDVQSTHYPVCLLGTVPMENVRVHFVEGQAIDMEADMVLNIETDDVPEATFICESNIKLVLQLPEWISSVKGFGRKLFQEQRIKLHKALEAILQHVIVNHIKKLVIVTENMRKPGLVNFPLDELAEAFVTNMTFVNVDSDLNVYICDTKRRQVLQSFRFFFKKRGLQMFPSSEEDWNDVASEGIIAVPNYSSIAKDKNVSVNICKESPWMRDKGYGGNTSSYSSYKAPKRWLCIPVTEDFDNASFYWPQDFKKFAERSVALQYPDGLLPGQTYKITYGQDEILLYGCPYDGIGTQKILAKVIDECIKHGNGNDIYICLPRSRLVLSQTVFVCLDSWMDPRKILRGTKINFYSQITDVKKALDEELLKRQPKPKGFFKQFKSLVYGPDENESDGGGPSIVVKTEPQSTKVTFSAESEGATNLACSKLYTDLVNLMNTNKRELKLNTGRTDLHKKAEILLKEDKRIDGHIKYHKKKKKQRRRNSAGYSSIEFVLTSLSIEHVRYFLREVEAKVGSALFSPGLEKQLSNLQRPNSFSEGMAKHQGDLQRYNSVTEEMFQNEGGSSSHDEPIRETSCKPRLWEPQLEHTRPVGSSSNSAAGTSGDSWTQGIGGRKTSEHSEDVSDYESCSDETDLRDVESSVDSTETELRDSSDRNMPLKGRLGQRHSKDLNPHAQNTSGQRNNGAMGDGTHVKWTLGSVGDAEKSSQSMAGGNTFGAQECHSSGTSSDSPGLAASKMGAAHSTERLTDMKGAKPTTSGSQRYIWLMKDNMSSHTKFVACHQELSENIERLYSEGFGGVQIVCGNKVDFAKLSVVQSDGPDNCLIRRDNINPECLDDFNDQVPRNWPEGGKIKGEKIKDHNKINKFENFEAYLQAQFPGKEVDITKIEEIQNSELLKRFQWKQKKSEDCNVRQMWHRIDPQYKKQVYEFGLHYSFMAVPEAKLPKSKRAVCWFFEDLSSCVSQRDVHDQTEIFLVLANVLTTEEGPHCSIKSDAMAMPEYLVIMSVKD